MARTYQVTLTGSLTLEPDGGGHPDWDPPEPPPVVLGETVPTTLGIHTPAASIGPRVPEVRLTPYAGSFENVADGEVIERLAITGRFSPTAPTFTLRDSLVLGGVPFGDDPANSPDDREGNWWLLNCVSDAITDGLIEHVEVRPTYRSSEVGGFKGGNVTLANTWIHGVADGAQPHGSKALRKFMRMHGCRIDGLEVYPDPGQADGFTHNDGAQASGALDLMEFVGNLIRGGRTSCLLIMQNVGTYTTVLVDRNWLLGDTEEGSTLNTAENGLGPIAADGSFTVSGNRFSKTGHSNHAYIASATLDSPTFLWTPDNVYLEDGSPVTPKRG